MLLANTEFMSQNSEFRIEVETFSLKLFYSGF